MALFGGSDKSFDGRTAIIFGGSKGIGKETAKEIVRLGGNVCILARDSEILNSAADEIYNERISDIQFVEKISTDATNKAQVEKAVNSIIERHGVPDYLINAVGFAYPGYVKDLKMSDFENSMRVNYYGQLIPTLTLLPYFMEARAGHISFISSLVLYFSIIGYAAYAPSKFAVIGLAEILRHELKPYDIDVSVLYPPDTDTPGFEKENETKPEETIMISETGKLRNPKDIARVYAKGLLKNRFHITTIEGKLLFYVARLAPQLLHSLWDWEHKKARKKLNKEF